VNQGEVNPCIIVDDIIRSGHAIERDSRAGEVARRAYHRLRRDRAFRYAPEEVEGVPIKSLIDFDVKMYESDEECTECREGVTPKPSAFKTTDYTDLHGLIRVNRF
jgi:hypothetical protein